MPRPKLPPELKKKRNLFTLDIQAQALIDKVPDKEKSKDVSKAIIKHLSPLK